MFGCLLSQGVVSLIHMFDSPNPPVNISNGTAAAAFDVAAPAAAPVTGSGPVFDVAGLAPDVTALVDGLDADGCVRIVQLEGIRRRLDAERAAVLATLEADGVCDTEHGMRTGSWVAAVCSQPSGSSTTLVRHSKQVIGWFPVLYAALQQAQIGWSHIEAVLRASNPRIINNLGAIQAELLVLASHYTFDQWCKELVAICQMIDVDGSNDPTDTRTSSLKTAETSDGMCHLDVWLAPEHKLPFLNTLDLITDRLYRQAMSDADTIRRSHRTGCPLAAYHATTGRTAGSNSDSPVAVCVCGVSDGVGVDPAEYKMPTRSELRAAALAEMARLANGAMHKKYRNPIADVTIVIHTDTATLTVNGSPISEDLMRVLAPEAMWRFMHTTTTGVILELSRTQRTATKDLRHALNIRDGGCVFPQCSAPQQHCDAHHVTHWADGGHTNPTNMVLLCRYHHSVTHRNRWNMEHTGNQTFAWTTPNGRVIHSQRHHKTVPTGPPEPRPEP